MSAPVAAAELAAPLALVAVLAGVLLALLELLLEELDEHAASSSAAPTARTPNAARAARGFRLLILSMHPRIYIQGLPDRPAPQRCWVSAGLSTHLLTKNGSRFGLYRRTSSGAQRMCLRGT
jgi:hypothetical protein